MKSAKGSVYDACEVVISRWPKFSLEVGGLWFGYREFLLLPFFFPHLQIRLKKLENCPASWHNLSKVA